MLGVRDRNKMMYKNGTQVLVYETTGKSDSVENTQHIHFQRLTYQINSR